MSPSRPSLLLLILAAAPLLAQTEGFDGAPVATSTACSTTGTGFPYNGWTNDPGDVNTSFRIWTGSTGSANTGPAGDVCGTGNYAYLETSCSANPNVGSLVSPVYPAAGLPAPTVSFWYHMYGATMGTLELQESDGIGGWTTVWSLAGDQGNSWFQQEIPIATYDVGNGPEARFRFRGTRGSSLTSDMAVDEIRFGSAGGGTQNQSNGANASLDLTGAACSQTSCGVVGPAFRSLFGSQSTSVTISSGVNGVQPYALAHTPGFGVIAGTGIFTPAGLLDFSLAGYSTLEFLIDGIGGTRFIDLWLGSTLPGGSRTLDFVIPSGPAGTLTAIQGLVIDPTAAVGSRLTAATQLDRAAGSGVLPSNWLGSTPLVLGDSTSVNIAFATGFTFPFYGAFYSDCYVNSDGSITFGGDDVDSSESIFDLENEEARVAGWWDDLDVTEAGQVTYTLAASTLLVSWSGVTEDGLANENHFAILLDQSGLVSVFYGIMDATDGLAGITPGFNSPGGPPNPGISVDLGAAAPQSLLGGPQDSIFELFPTGAGDLGIDACGGGTPMLNFVPRLALAIPGDAGYTAP